MGFSCHLSFQRHPVLALLTRRLFSNSMPNSRLNNTINNLAGIKIAGMTEPGSGIQNDPRWTLKGFWGLEMNETARIDMSHGEGNAKTIPKFFGLHIFSMIFFC